ncbi:TetR/AcrR family transcriptional regulator [Shewanella sp. VB17]|uniref:TetR/AcrR family transcriptional regulator n=1 Tax=Shewanella sp. VB17 TaxID=2739432 RepID=UPI0015630340|nr:TetR/AcrR family transcriptional regulator [Shewanella sp. VB17]NRD75760.1 TetR/AcrR family transcriptional regulator [Shewanella sp. VB17]
MDNKRERIFSATEKIIAAEGLQGLSMQKIATEAEISAGTIYRYFTDKEALIFELRKNVLCKVSRYILADCQNGDLKQKFQRIWFNMVDFASQRTPTTLSYEQYIHLPGIDSDPHQTFEKTIFGGLHQFFETGKAQDKFHRLSNKILFSISMEPAMALARSIRRGQIKYDENELEIACEICWKTLLKSTPST